MSAFADMYLAIKEHEQYFSISFVEIEVHGLMIYKTELDKSSSQTTLEITFHRV